MMIEVEIGEKVHLRFKERPCSQVDICLTKDDAKRLGSLLFSYNAGEFQAE